MAKPTIDEAWLAGIIEGEGHVGPKYQARGRTNQVRIVVQMTDRDVIERVAAVWGSSIREVRRHAGSRDHHKTQYAAEICGTRVDRLLERIGYLLGQRRQERIAEIRAWKAEDPH